MNKFLSTDARSIGVRPSLIQFLGQPSRSPAGCQLDRCVDAHHVPGLVPIGHAVSLACRTNTP